ncbi:PAS domain S-box protein [Roseateles sp. DAIF2]|uniref:PAS domain S-box protein n=1 Tax=Roseateles sp. DAIF2 TaxID=2714952 RepID=UPI0018A332C8|nr:PAS domain S-box protein [Roseateles sp. DAIF2]QPF73747.1 PAS domain S-box protein [Roseateles sp. DAIF2]
MSTSTALPPLPRTAFRLGHARLGYWPVWLCALLSLALGLAMLRVQQQQQRGEERLHVEQRLTLLRDRLEASAQATFSPTLGLSTLIQVDGGISEQRFEQLIQRAVTLVPQLRSVVAAPDDVARHVYPRAGNEAVFNLDYRRIPEQWAQVQEARQRRQPLLRAPVPLVQGGLGVIQRTPVFLRGEDGGGGEPRYWGVVSVVADLERFVQAAGLSAEQELELALHAATPEGRPGALIWGHENTAEDGVHLSARLPGADWLLLARPRAGWGQASPWSPMLLMLWSGGALITALLALLMRQWHALCRHNEALTHEIEQGQRMRSQLEESQARFRSLASLASDWVWEQDAELRFTYISRMAEEASNTDSSLVLGHRRWDSPALVPGIAWDEHRALLERHETFRDFEYAQISSDGSVRHLSVSGAPIFDAQGRFGGYRGTGRDVTVQRRAEAALRASQAELQAARDRLQAVLDAAVEVAIVATDAEDRITVFNRGAERMLGYSEPEVLGRSPHLWHLPEEIAARAAEAQAELGVPVAPHEAFIARPLRQGSDTRIWTFVRRDGRRLEASLTVSGVYDRDGQLVGFLGVARDISAQLSAERALRNLNAELEQRVAARTAELGETLETLQHAQEELMRAERMAALGSLVAGVAHELNTPLGNCLTTASTLEGRSREIAGQLQTGSIRRSGLEAYLHDVGTASDILLRGLTSACELVQHFKQLSVDQTSEQRRSFPLQDVVGDVLGLARARWKSTPYRIETEIAELPRQLDSYPGPLGQVLSNLLQNALMHAFDGRDGGLLRIRARPLSDEGFELVIEDDGRGMSEEVRRRAFDPFFTTKLGRGGTGLGLNIVYNIVNDVLGGKVELSSRPGEGCRFVFRLPYVAPQLAG